MTVLGTCPECGFKSPEIRCPRCNALKVIGCSGACTLCHEQCESEACVSTGPGSREASSHESPATRAES